MFERILSEVNKDARYMSRMDRSYLGCRCHADGVGRGHREAQGNEERAIQHNWTSVGAAFAELRCGVASSLFVKMRRLPLANEANCGFCGMV